MIVRNGCWDAFPDVCALQSCAICSYTGQLLCALQSQGHLGSLRVSNRNAVESRVSVSCTHVLCIDLRTVAEERDVVPDSVCPKNQYRMGLAGTGSGQTEGYKGLVTSAGWN